MTVLYDSIRRRWRRLKEKEPWNGNAAMRFAYGALCSCARLAKRVFSGTDLEARALYLHYHPEFGIAPRDAWMDKVRREISPGELAELRARLAADRERTYRALGVTEAPLDGVQPLDEGPSGRVAIHLHAFYPDRLHVIAEALSCVPFPFDLYVSAPEGGAVDEAFVRRTMEIVPWLRTVVFRLCPNRGRDIAPLVCLFGRELAHYRYVAHFHTKKSPHDAAGRGWLDFTLERLVGSSENCRRIFRLLSYGCGMVSAADFLEMSEDPSGWGANLALAQDLLHRAEMNVDLAEMFPVIAFPQGSMFWARTDFLRRLLELPLAFDDFPEEPVRADGTMAHALERLFYVWGLGTGLGVRRIP